MAKTDTYGKLRIEERNGILTAQFRKAMKYGKLINDALEIKEFENGMEVGGSLTEQQAVKEGYKPVCEVEQPSDAEFCVYKEYDVCFVQIWKRADEEVQEDEIWTADSGVMPKYSDLQRLTRDIAMVTENINTIPLSNKEKNNVKELYPKWEDFIGENLDEIGFTINYKNKLYEVIQPIRPVLEHQTPDAVPANYGLVSEHGGTKDDPIPYEKMMIIRKDKYYTDNGKLYIGLIDAPNGYDASLEQLPTIAKEVKE